MERERPDQQPRRAGERRDGETDGVAATTPRRKEGQQGRDDAEHARGEEALRQEADTDPGAEPEAAERRAPQGEREAVEAGGETGQERDVGDELVAADHD